MFVVACSGSPSPGIGSAPSPGAGSPSSPGADPGADDAAPHALGTITLGESHASGSSAVAPLVSVSFFPDASAANKCTKDVAGCELTAIPKCASACKDGEVCALDASTCAPKCQPGSSTKKPESFDAGPVAFGGTTTALTLFPPYSFDGDIKGAPFLAGAEIHVQASGATGAGFEAFDDKFTATRFIQTSPALGELAASAVFGKAPLAISWAAGSDAVAITLVGEAGSVRCKADDASGHADVPREAVRAALGSGTSLSVTVARERREVHKGKKTKGQLSNATVQPVGWLELTTTSRETASFTCSGAECSGASTCAECMQTSCKTESDACASDAICPDLSACLDACVDSACRSACFTQYPDPAARAKNGALFKCKCTAACATSCSAECK